MSPLSIRSFTLFREEQPVRDALVLFTLTLLLHFFGAMLRLVQELSFFWPLNAVMAGGFDAGTDQRAKPVLLLPAGGAALRCCWGAGFGRCGTRHVYSPTGGLV